MSGVGYVFASADHGAVGAGEPGGVGDLLGASLLKAREDVPHPRHWEALRLGREAGQG